MAKTSGLNAKLKPPVSSGGSSNGNNNNKRKYELILPARMEKRQRIDRNSKLQCRMILNTLMSHPYGFVFNTPVDPVALRIPDYFNIISHPMDFGTIKLKLDDDMYLNAEEFADDVRLTFSNALFYNPPDNQVHQMAKELESVFKSKWKLLDAKLNCQTGFGQGFSQSGSGLTAQEDLPKAAYKNPQSDASAKKSILYVAKKSMLLEEKQMLMKEVMGMLRGKMTEKLRTLLKKFKLIGSQDFDISAFDVATLRELKRMLKGSIQAMPAKTIQNGVCPISEKVDHKGACPSGPSVTSITSKCSSNGVTRHHCGSLMSNLLSSSNCRQTSNALSSSSENSLGDHCHATTTTQDSEVKSTCCDTDGSGSFVDENTFTSPGVSAPLKPAVSSEGSTSLSGDEWSMKKALRAAMLKSRFAETIVKANGDTSDPRKMQQERERLERLQQEEEAKIKARMEAEKLKLKMQREGERKAARVLLEKIEKTVYHEDNLSVIRELEMFGIYRCRNPLVQLGLYLKDDYMADESDEETILNGDREEGEILQ